MHDAGWVHALLIQLREVGLDPSVWRGVTPNPKDSEITEGYRQYLESGCDVLIGIGGGSAMDAARASPSCPATAAPSWTMRGSTR